MIIPWLNEIQTRVNIVSNALLGTSRIVKAGAALGAGYVDAVNISAKGLLTGITICFNGNPSSTASVQLKIIIDGTTLYDEYVLQSGTDALGKNISLSFFHRFNTSLQIQHATYGAGINTTITYTTD